MPELPDLTIYIEALQRRIIGRRLEKVRLASPFVVRTARPPLTDAEGHAVREVRRLGKRIVIGIEPDLFLLIHLMIAGRLHWKEHGAKISGKIGLAAFDCLNGTLLVTEASTKKRAAIHVVQGESGLREFDPGGLEPLEIDAQTFHNQLKKENHTLKRALTDPRLFSGIGNAYSDEILHRARLSPLTTTGRVTAEAAQRLYNATREVLTEWVERLRAETGDRFPEKVTAFRKEMAVHGRYRRPCPVCGSPVQRIVYSENEANYCATCQTGGQLLADRALSRLLKSDWPKTLDELEQRMKPDAPSIS